MKNFLIMPNVKKDKHYKVTSDVIAVLLENGASVYAEGSVCGAIKHQKLSCIDVFDKKNELDCIIVIGGDGSILDASEIAIERDIPILGINMGRLGYLSEIPADSLGKLSKLFSGEFNISERMTLDVYISKNGVRELKKRKAVNDVVVSNGKALGISDFELDDSLGNSFSYRADGVILSTPTGSTAYSLSAGGPAIDNSLEAICATPICPHSFFNRSILFSPSLNVSVKHISENDEVLYVNIDGIDTYTLTYRDKVTVTKSARPLKLVSLENTGILGVLHEKMDI